MIARAQSTSLLTPQAYLDIERQNDYKSEYRHGAMFAMAGASRAHTLIVANLVAGLHGQLRKRPCEIYPNDMRVRIPRTNSYTYPDVIVVCGKPEFEDDHRDTLLNPTVLIEVLSPSTEQYDRGAKFRHYRKLDSLQEYVLVSQDMPQIERYVRQPEIPFWLFAEATGLDAVLELTAIQCRLALADVYEKVELPPEPLPGGNANDPLTAERGIKNESLTDAQA